MCYGMGCRWEDSYGECRYPYRTFSADEGCVCVEREDLDEEEDEETERDEDDN